MFVPPPTVPPTVFRPSQNRARTPPRPYPWPSQNLARTPPDRTFCRLLAIFVPLQNMLVPLFFVPLFYRFFVPLAQIRLVPLILVPLAPEKGARTPILVPLAPEKGARTPILVPLAPENVLVPLFSYP